MAKTIGTIGTSDVPTIGVAYVKGKQQDPVRKPLLDGHLPADRRRLHPSRRRRERRAD